MSRSQLLALAEVFQIFEIADQHLVAANALEHRRLRRRHRGGNMRAHLVQRAAEIEQEIGLGTDRELAAADVEMRIEHRVDELAAQAAIFRRHRPCR